MSQMPMHVISSRQELGGADRMDYDQHEASAKQHITAPILGADASMTSTAPKRQGGHAFQVYWLSTRRLARLLCTRVS
jgi:hypothetical protein